MTCDTTIQLKIQYFYKFYKGWYQNIELYNSTFSLSLMTYVCQKYLDFVHIWMSWPLVSSNSIFNPVLKHQIWQPEKLNKKSNRLNLSTIIDKMSSNSCFLIVIVILKVCKQHGFPWLFLVICPYQPSQPWQVLKTAASVHTELMNVKFCCSPNACMLMSKIPLENISYKVVFAPLAIPSMSCSFYLDGLWDGK